MVTLAQELAIADILNPSEPLLDAVQTFLDQMNMENYWATPSAVTIEPHPLENVIRVFTTDQARHEVADIYKGIRGKGYEKR